MPMLNLQKFPPLKEKLIAQVNHMLDKDIADLMAIVPTDFSEPVIRGGAFDDVKDMTSPFGFEKCEGKFNITNDTTSPFSELKYTAARNNKSSI